MRKVKYIILLIAVLLSYSQLSGQSIKNTFKLVQIYDGIRKAEKKNDYAELASLYSEWMKISPDDPSIISNSANAFFKNKQYNEAISTYQKLLDFGGYARDLSIWTNLIECYSKIGQLNKVVQYISQQLEKYPKNEVAFSALAYAHIANENYEDAILATKRSIELSSENPEAYFFQGMAYGGLKNYKSAIEAMKKSIAFYPKFSEAYLLLGRYLINYNETEEAITILKKGISEDANSSLLHLMLGIANFNLGKYSDAYNEIDKAVNMESNLGIGISIEIVNKYPVIKNIQDNTPAYLAELKPGDIIMQINAKSTKKLDADEAIEMLSQKKGESLSLLMERNGNSFTKVITTANIPKSDAAIALAMRSILSRYTKNKTQQKEDIFAAESLRNDDETTKEYISMAKGLMAMDEGNYELTIQQMSKVPDNSFARMYEALAFAKKSLFNASLSHYLQIPIEDLAPEYIPLIQDNKVLMELYKPQVIQHKEKAEEYLAKNMPQDALFELSEAVKQSEEKEKQLILDKMFSIIAENPTLGEIPESARKYALRSEILLKEGNLDDAVAETKKAINEAPYIAVLYYNMALIKSELGKYAEAIKYMQVYMKGLPNAPNIRQAKDDTIKWEFMLERNKGKQ